MRQLLTAFSLIVVHVACAQITIVPIPRSPGTKTTASTAGRTKAALTLPFWDDFSEANIHAPSPDKWFAGRSTWVNDGLGINPPSLHVASFDGVDSIGNPYNINDVLAKGYADKLESFPIDLMAIPAGERGTVYLSFYYQMKGRGELPDAGDRLLLEFRNASNKWEEVWSIENNGTLTVDAFTQVVVSIAAEKFYHPDFRFRFKNFARLSGPYDTWHIDYVYINKGRTATDTSYPDRSIVSPLTSFLKSYQSIPKKHFFVDKNAAMVKPTMVVHNLRIDNNQPLNYFSYAQIDKYSGTTAINGPVVLMDSATTIGSVNALEYKTAEVNTKNLVNLLDEDADSLLIRLKVGLSTKDNLPPAQDGDYDPKFAPIDFRVNDTTRTEYWLSSYYAYDDGAAEYGAALNQPGSQMAYEFNLVGDTTGYINAVQMYFPQFGYGLSQVIELRIWNDLLGLDGSILYSEVVTLGRTSNNVFWIKKLNKNVKVSRRFYVGWKQSTSAIIAVGYDKNNNSGDKINFNINGTWERNTLLTGSLMIRPVFGEGSDEPDPDPVNSVEENYLDAGRLPYPNPSDGTFIIPGHVQQVTVIDVSGRAVGLSVTEGSDETQVMMTNPSPGMFIVRYLRDGRPRLSKVMVR